MINKKGFVSTTLIYTFLIIFTTLMLTILFTYEKNESNNDIFEESIRVDLLNKTKLLPDIYQQVEYIESTGTQWIDTGYIANNNANFKIEFSNVKDSSTIFGGGDNYYSNYIGLFVDFIENNVSLRFGKNPDNNLDEFVKVENSYNSSNKNTVILDGNLFKVNDKFKNINSEEFITNYPIYIFAYNRSNIVGEYSKIKLYSFKIYEGDVIKRDFVPCYRKSDFKPGLFDIINNKFYTSNGNGELLFSISNDFQMLEYIESTGTQWIDTKTRPTKSLTSKIKFTNLEKTGDVIYGYYNSSDIKDYRLFNYENKAYFDIPGGLEGTEGVRFIGDLLECNKIYELQLGRDEKYQYYLKNLNSNVDLFHNNNQSDFNVNDNNATITLNHYVNGDTISNSKNRWYYVEQIDKENDIHKYFVPCYRKSDGKTGMYDIINDEFYENKGTGNDFLYESIIGD